MFKKFLVLTFLAFSVGANAASVYSYTGGNLTTAFGDPSYSLPDQISLTLTLDDALAADLGSQVDLVDITSLSGFHLTMTSGSLNLDSALPGRVQNASVATDASGNILAWDFGMSVVHLKFGVAAGLSTVGPACELNASNDIECSEGTDQAWDTFSGNRTGYSGSNGIWSAPSQVPIPATVWLFGSALFGLMGVARRQKR